MLNTKPKKDRIEEIKTNGYQLDFGTVFESAFENYKKIALYAGLMLLVFSVFISIAMLIGLVSYIGVDHLEEFGKKTEQLKTLKVIPLEIALPLNAGLILISTILSPFMAGFFKMADCGEKGEEFHISTMFSYYKSPYFLNLISATFIILLISKGLAMLLENAGFGFAGTVITLLISFITILTLPLIVFGKLNAIDAIQSSIIIVFKQPLVLLGLIIVAVIGVLLGLFGFCIGVFFTWPFIYSMNYVIYKTIIGIDDETEIEKTANREM